MDVTNGFQKIIYLNCFTDWVGKVLSGAKMDVTNEFQKIIYLNCLTDCNNGLSSGAKMDVTSDFLQQKNIYTL